MSVNLYYAKKEDIFYITNVVKSNSNTVVVRLVNSSHPDKLLLVYLFLLAKYSTTKINIYSLDKKDLFIQKFDSITKKYSHYVPQKMQIEQTEKANMLTLSSDSTNFRTSMTVHKTEEEQQKQIQTLLVSNTDLKFLLMHLKKFRTSEVIHSFTTFWNGTLKYSANCLISGLFPAFQMEGSLIVCDMVFPILLINDKVCIFESFNRYFPFCYDKISRPCSVDGILIDGNIAMQPISKISNTPEIIDQQTLSTMLEYVKSTHLISPELRSIVEFLTK